VEIEKIERKSKRRLGKGKERKNEKIKIILLLTAINHDMH
jgi:hypothetical protein